MKVLWFSDHELTKGQLDDLKQIYGKSLHIKRAHGTVQSWKEVVEAAADCDVIAAVLPVHILAELTNPELNSKPVIQSASRRVLLPNQEETGNTSKTYRFEHMGWYQVTKAEVKNLSMKDE